MSAAGTISKHFDSAAVEQKWRAVWEKGDWFNSAPHPEREKNYCIMLPPPNVTGALHMGHAFQHALMDALIRRERMRGRNVLWQPGTDHAGIATQIVVTRELAAQNIDAASLSREEFLRRAWEWKARSGDVIASQMRRLGASCDWSRERFTMDETLSATVTEVFVRLYDEGLIYRGKRMVNWDPAILTAVSDLEVVGAEEDGVMYYVRYPFVGDENGGVVIGTTRPETILVDGAIAVHPEDARYKKLIGARVWVPLTEPRRAIEIIADSHVEPEFGSGCVKITAAHDFNDYEVYKRHPDKNIPVIVLFTPDAKMNDNAPRAYRGLDRHVAREHIVRDLAAAGLLVRQTPHRYKLPRGDRSGAVVEPMLTDQWFMKMDGLAQKAAARSADGAPNFVPARWRKTYDLWLHNIQDWCLSRQLRWGHRIPAWYDEDGGVYVARDEAEVLRQAGGKTLRRDADVLDTWFSSALWPFSTLDWPRTENAHFRHYFPGSVLITGFDIIFFWVARMAMMSGHLTGETPFRDVYITGLVRDSAGQKMSKSRGNVLDPLDLTDGIDADSLVRKRTSGLMNPKQAGAIAAATRAQFPDGIPAFGADALRFTFASLASHGRDIKFDLARCGGHRNFCNKIWNAARFVLHSCEDYDADAEIAPPRTADLWIESRLQRACAETAAAYDGYRFDLAAAAAHRFLWHEYCDWYLELAKIALRDSPPVRARAQYTLIRVMEAALRLLHPLMPFITEELWAKIAPLAGENAPSMSRAPWPEADAKKIDEAAENKMATLFAAVDACRRLREESEIPSAARPVLLVRDDAGQFDPISEEVKILCKFSAAEIRSEMPSGLPQSAAAGFYFALDLRADKTEMRARLSQKLR
ncbi:MAG: valine--tRNA ligase, partial [Gammaproteobacteria bacterium]